MQVLVADAGTGQQLAALTVAATPAEGDGDFTAVAGEYVTVVGSQGNTLVLTVGKQVTVGVDLTTGSVLWRNTAENQFVAIGPSRERDDAYVEPSLSPDEAEQAATDLEELAEQAKAGYTPPKPSKFARSAQRVRQMLATDDDLKPGDRVPVGYDDDTLPITYSLLGLLIQADPHAGGGSRRTVRAKACRDSGGDDGIPTASATWSTGDWPISGSGSC